MPRPKNPVYWIVERYAGNFDWITCWMSREEEPAREKFEQLEREEPRGAVRLTRIMAT